jgi:ubiquinone/menaquinone biosynthesis C-methylase UbiE/uncharacterized protein YbaR (Trm112 family)
MRSKKMLKANDLIEHLICPDCRGRLVAEGTARLVCAGCKRVFGVKGNLMLLLPTDIGRNYEDEAWKTLPREGEGRPPWMALLHKRDRVLYFYDEVLPKVDFVGKVLEIGAGTCWASALIKKKYPTSLVVASDISPYALEKGSDVAQLLESTVDYRVACDAERLPFSDEYFDVLLSNAAIHHLNPQEGISEIWRVLRRGGVCYALGEVAAGMPFKSILASRIGPAGRRGRALSIKERVYSLKEWRQFFRMSRFEKVTYSFEKAWQYKLYDWFTALYYRWLSSVPDFFIGDFLPCNVDVYATK